MDNATLTATRQELYRLKLGLIEHYADTVGDEVVAGPFTGLKIPARGYWAGGDLVAKVFGLYESQLNPFWCEAVAAGYALFLDVGCADGFYATGFALRSPGTRCVGFDRDERAQTSARAQIARNALGNCEIRGMFDATSIPVLQREFRLSRDARLLLKCDIEGAERELFSEQLCAQLDRADILVELHDFQDDTAIEDLLRSRLAPSHRIEIMGETGRNPNLHRLLRHIPEDIRWLLISESRWSAMRWLLARAR